MRYLPLSDADRAAMLDAVGVREIDELFVDVPAELRNPTLSSLPDHAGEMAVDRRFRDLSRRNLPAFEHPFFVGCGAYRHHVPASVDHLIQRGEFLTAYTPYQPEIAQGTLAYLFEFQSQVAALLGMEVANASMYDGSTATAEAVLMARRLAKRREKVVLAGGLHPHYRSVVETMLRFRGEKIAVMPAHPAAPSADLAAVMAAIDEDTACVVVQTPDVFGHLHDLSPLAEAAHKKGALLVAVTTEVVSLGTVRSPGEMGADIVVAEGQSLGVGLNFGGPHLGLFATRQKFVRQMPGRLVGETVDADGRRGYVLTLSAREQHIRREKATSNICTNSGLAALAFTIHLTLLGEVGLRRLARLNHARTLALVRALEGLPGVEILNDLFFNEVTVRLDRPAAPVVSALAERDILAGVPATRLFGGDEADAQMDRLLILAVTETVRETDIELLAQALRDELGGGAR
ncbi:MAG: aminomethyl-transferring glycine dehydrogenase subunit GcvPA [Alphaproteobacteria bacterium]|nr:MAG: aminomethyl-transferring glycine dehydrogenase subunit GcvPA [Alphaproteobacteria bacterium]